MIKIINRLEDKEMIVTNGAYENLYKGLGYKIVGEKEPVVEKPTVAPVEPEVKPEEHNDSDDLFNQIKAKKENNKKR